MHISNPGVDSRTKAEESNSLSRQGPLQFQRGLSNRKTAANSWVNIINTSFLDDLPSYISHRSHLGLNLAEDDLNHTDSRQAVSQSAHKQPTTTQTTQVQN